MVKGQLKEEWKKKKQKEYFNFVFSVTLGSLLVKTDLNISFWYEFAIGLLHIWTKDTVFKSNILEAHKM